MKIGELLARWDAASQMPVPEATVNVRLPLADVAKLHALAELYPGEELDDIVRELIVAALTEMEASFPYVRGSRIIGEDENGDPFYEDIGLTPRFLDLTRKHLERLRQADDDSAH